MFKEDRLNSANTITPHILAISIYLRQKFYTSIVSKYANARKLYNDKYI